MRFIFLLFTLIILAFSGFSSSLSTSQNKHSDHGHSEWELGAAFGAVYLLGEKEVASGLHLHLLRRLEFYEKLGIGLGFETVLDEHKHFSTGIVFKYEIWKGLNFLVSPGILFLKPHNEWEKQFSIHYELLYEFKVKGLHLGPVFDYSYSKNDQHLMLGLHVGYSF